MRRLALALALLACALPARAILQEEVVELTATVADYTGRAITRPFKVTVFRDDAVAKAPFLVLNHGRPARSDDFKTMGRQRYGPSGGKDVEYPGAWRPAFEDFVRRNGFQ